MEGARLGFGNDRIYLSMLRYLGKEGHFAQAKELFEVWIGKRDGKEKSDIHMMGGFIYGNLLDLDNAITSYRKAIELDRTSTALSSLGKLHLVKGEKERALSYLRKAFELEPDPVNGQVISIISEEDWKMKRLTLCMIAKDEEETIRQALESVKDIVDEVIVVDTGSSDKTREIVREFGGKVIDAEWQDDFSAARNLALSEATGDYILCLDADEFIDPRERFGLLLAKELLPPARETRAYRIKVEPAKEAVELSVSYLSRLKGQEPADYQIRIFPAGMGIRFNGAAFESVDESLRHLGIEATGNDIFKITHSKPDGKVRDQRKIPSVLKYFKSDPDPAKALEGGLFFLRLGDLDRAYTWLEKTEKMEPALSVKIAQLYSMKNQHDRAKTIIEKGLEYSPESPDLILALAGVYHKEGQYNKVRELLSDRIDLIRKDLDPEAAAEASYYYGIALLEADLLAEGIDYIAYASEENPQDTGYMTGSIYAFSKAGQWETAIELAGRIVDREGIEIDREINDFADVALVFMELTRHFGQSGRVDEESMCRKIIEIILQTQSLKKEEMEKMAGMLESEEERTDG
jgi:glycosyltransferase involved in cell wall biosynthesis